MSSFRFTWSSGERNDSIALFLLLSVKSTSKVRRYLQKLVAKHCFSWQFNNLRLEVSGHRCSFAREIWTCLNYARHFFLLPCKDVQCCRERGALCQPELLLHQEREAEWWMLSRRDPNHPELCFFFMHLHWKKKKQQGTWGFYPNKKINEIIKGRKWNMPFLFSLAFRPRSNTFSIHSKWSFQKKFFLIGIQILQ